MAFDYLLRFAFGWATVSFLLPSHSIINFALYLLCQLSVVLELCFSSLCLQSHIVVELFYALLFSISKKIKNWSCRILRKKHTKCNKYSTDSSNYRTGMYVPFKQSSLVINKFFELATTASLKKKQNRTNHVRQIIQDASENDFLQIWYIQRYKKPWVSLR